MDIIISQGQYKSIGPLVWRGIPKLAVLTGVNGSGKSQLLEILYNKLGVYSTGPLNPFYQEFNSVHLKVVGESFEPYDVALIHGEWTIGGSQSLSVAQFQQIRTDLFQQVRDDPHSKPLRLKLEQLTGKPLESLTQGEFEAALPQDFALAIRSSGMGETLTRAFLAYRGLAADRRELGADEHSIRAALGPPPWEVLNSILEVSELPYTVITPVGQPLFGTYQLKLRDRHRGIELDPDLLSSGEKVLMGLAMWLFRSRHEHGLPKLLLLDEPDAHLHPSMTRQLLDVIQEVLVRDLGLRVIMTTHSPSTVALAPEESVFEMRRDGERIVRAPSRAHAVNILTSGLITVGPNTRYVLVEDEADTEFFTTVWTLLTERTPSHPPELEGSPNLVFVRASIGSRHERVGGGKTVVEGWVDKLTTIGLAPQFQGLIDRDTGNTATKGIWVLQRFSLENYLFDPLVVYTLLVDLNAQPVIEGIEMGIGHEHTIRTLESDKLQKIIDTVLLPVAANLPALGPSETEGVEVGFVSGHTLRYPRWMLDRRGKDLRTCFQNAYGGPNRINQQLLLRSYRRLRMVPLDLRDTFHSLQTSDA